MSGLYRGDVVWVPLGPETVRAVVREVQGDRVKIQIGHDWTWVVAGELTWEGECLTKVPWTERGWRRLGTRRSFPVKPGASHR